MHTRSDGSCSDWQTQSPAPWEQSLASGRSRYTSALQRGGGTDSYRGLHEHHRCFRCLSAILYVRWTKPPRQSKLGPPPTQHVLCIPAGKRILGSHKASHAPHNRSWISRSSTASMAIEFIPDPARSVSVGSLASSGQDRGCPSVRLGLLDLHLNASSLRRKPRLIACGPRGVRKGRPRSTPRYFPVILDDSILDPAAADSRKRRRPLVSRTPASCCSSTQPVLTDRRNRAEARGSNWAARH